MIETAQSIMNWMTFMDAPTWYWLHALKPTYNEEAVGYGLGLWRPSDDPIEPGDPHADIAPQHWQAIPTNWHGVAPFVQHLPWDSTRLQVDERVVRTSQRIMAWDSPEGDLGIALTNRSDSPFRFNIDLGSGQTIEGHRYDKTVEDQLLGEKTGQIVQVVVPPKTIEIWTAKGDSAPGTSSPVLATGIPGLPVVSDNARERTGLSDGNYTVTTNMWWGNNASSITLFENGVPIRTESLTDASPTAQAVRVPVSGKANGTYSYVAELSNKWGTQRSAPHVVEVTDASPGKPVLSHDNWDGNGRFTVTADLWWGTNATSYRVYENDVVVAEGSLTAASPSAQRATYSPLERPAGDWTYRVEFVNAAGTTSSAPLVVKVSG
jgi:hypothetical protein